MRFNTETSLQQADPLQVETSSSRHELLKRVKWAMSICWRSGRWTTVQVVFIALVSAVSPAFFAWLFKILIDRLTQNQSTSVDVGLTVLAMAVAMLVIAVAPVVFARRTKQMQREASFITTDRLVEAVGHIPGISLFEKPHYLDKLRVASREGSNAPSAIFLGLLAVGSSGVSVAAFGVALIAVGPLIAGAVLLSAAPTFAGNLWLTRRRVAAFSTLSRSQRFEESHSDVFSSVPAAKEMRSYDTGNFFRRRMLTLRRESNLIEDDLDRREWLVHTGLTCLSVVAAVVALLVAVQAAQSGEATPGDVAVTFAAVLSIQAGLADSALQFSEVQHHLLVFGYYLETLSSTGDVANPINPLAVPELVDGIEFSDVWFRYGVDKPWVLEGVSFSISAGTSCGLVGDNGSGKSTLVKLICRFYDVDRGLITWDGIDIRCFDVVEFRNRVSILFQDFVDYNMSALDSIAVGDPSLGFDLSRVRDAARMAEIDSLICGLPDGYETMLGREFLDGDSETEGTGVALSGGQAQRVAIARALYRGRRDFVVFDEPTAALDPAADARFGRAMEEFRKGGTSLLVSHRLGSLRYADSIVVLDDGKVIERGSHSELIALDGRYCSMFAVQASGYI